jgi:glycosyltransferase involved in cell wall biosynthesis
LHLGLECTNLGLTKSLNKGIKLSQGKYIARQDADDVSLSNRLKIQYDFLEENPEIFLVSSSSILIDKKGNKIGVERAYLNPVRAKRKITVANCITHSSIFFRANKKIFYRNKFKYCQDYDLYLRLLTQGKKIFQLKNFLVKHRLKEESIGQQKKKEQLAYSKVARFFYREREKTGKDSYSSFDPKNITNNITREIEQEATKRKIIFYLRNDSYPEAEKVFKVYSAKSVKKIDLNKIALFLFIKIPFLYTIYKKVFD